MEWSSGNFYIRPSGILEKGQRCGGHQHNFDHTTVVFTGSVHVVKWAQLVNPDGTPMRKRIVLTFWQRLRYWPNGIQAGVGEELWVVAAERDYKAPAHFLIEANARHDIIALEDNTQYWCCYSHRSPQGDVVQEYTGWGPSYG